MVGGKSRIATSPLTQISCWTCDEIHGNYIRKTVSWEGSDDLSSLAGKPVRLHFVMRDAKLFAFQFETE